MFNQKKNSNLENTHKLFIIFDNNFGPLPFFTWGFDTNQCADITQKIALHVQQTMSMSSQWNDDYFEAVIRVGEFAIYAYSFLVPTIQAKRFNGETLGSLCFCLKGEAVTVLYSKAEQLKAAATKIQKLIETSFVYHGNRKEELPVDIKNAIKHWQSNLPSIST